MRAFLRSVYREKKYGAPIIVVSGLPRSGTSMIMSMLNAGGLKLVTDKIRTADEDNPKGYFEDERVKDLDKNQDKNWLEECKGKVVKIISFLLKDLPDRYQYKVIFMRRNLDEVIASQNKMLVRRGEPADEANNARMIKLYESHLKKVHFMLGTQANFDSIDVDYKQALENPKEHAMRIGKFLGMKLDLEKMANAADEKLYRNRR